MKIKNVFVGVIHRIEKEFLDFKKIERVNCTTKAYFLPFLQANVERIPFQQKKQMINEKWSSCNPQQSFFFPLLFQCHESE